MIGIDTNVLLRLVLQDAQGRQARVFFETLSEQEPDHINIITLLELTGTSASGLKLSREAIGQEITVLLESPHVQWEAEEHVDAALDGMLKCINEFAGMLVAIKNREAGFSHSVTFNHKAATTVARMEVIG